jgi:hypothetical protein
VVLPSGGDSSVEEGGKLSTLFARHVVVVLAFFGLVVCPTDEGGSADQDVAGDEDVTPDEDQTGDEDTGTDEATCQDECESDGARDCFGEGFRVCGDYDDDECLEWSDVTACGAGEGCYNGECSLVCTSECETDGEKRCVFGVEAWESCGDYNGDSCLEWGEQVECEAGYHCDSGACVCDEVCEVGLTRCVAGVEAYESCDDHDGNGCAEWGGQTDCQPDWTCVEATGRCVRPYPEGPYGTRYGDTVENECLDRVECDGSSPTGLVNFCFQEILDKKAKLITLHSGW